MVTLIAAAEPPRGDGDRSAVEPELDERDIEARDGDRHAEPSDDYSY